MTTSFVDRLGAAPERPEPFSHLVIDGLLERATADAVLAWLEDDADWGLQERSFYVQHTCHNADALRAGPLADVVSPAALSRLGATLGERFAIELDDDHVHVEAHRLLPGEGIGLHNDNPALGTESVRLVLHLARDYDDGHGGHLVLFSAEDPAAISAVIRPLHNTAVAFSLSERSYHAVSDVRAGARYSVVLGFYGKGRTPRQRHVTLEVDPAEQRAALGAVPGAEELRAALVAAGAGDRPGRSGSLLGHLEAVAGTMATWGASPELCRAALFHSAYGTASTERDPLFASTERPRLRGLVGPEAERLVWLFCHVRFGEVQRRDDEASYGAVDRVDGSPIALDDADVVALNLLAWANNLADGETLEVGYDAWLELCEVLEKVGPLLPARALSDLQRATAAPPAM